GVTRSSLHRWRRMARQGKDLAAQPVPGPHRRLTDLQLQELEAHGNLIRGEKHMKATIENGELDIRLPLNREHSGHSRSCSRSPRLPKIGRNRPRRGYRLRG